LFARRSLKEIDAWFDAYRATNLRLFTYPRPTVAAINGHAYAGGLITAFGCDYRIASEGALQFSLNEVRSAARSRLVIAWHVRSCEPTRARAALPRAERAGDHLDAARLRTFVMIWFGS
jgi:enoyl-CoA hydratase/carnithine racemase